MIVKIKRLTETAQLPKQNKGGNGFDLYADEDVTLYKGDLKLISTGISSSFSGAVAILKERSGLALKGIEVHAGVIDETYRGEWKVLLRNLGPIYRVHKGERIAQAVIIEQPDIFINEVEELDETERGDGGFGSTGT